MSDNVIDTIVAADMCVGCGICAGICPGKVLYMRMVKGEYKPKLIGQCLSKCSLCLQVCPFSHHNMHQNGIASKYYGQQRGIKHHPVVGYYQEAYIGYSNVGNHRRDGASGGMVTWVLERLFENKEIDRVLTVRPNTEQNAALFEMAILDSVQQIREAASSRYYPVEYSGALHRILNEKEEHRYAVTGLPCFLHGIRSAQQKYKKLSRRIPYLLGLVCGYCPSAYYTELLCKWSGVRVSEIQTVGYRFKEGMRGSDDFIFKAQTSNGKWTRSLPFWDVHPRSWAKYYFSHNVCNYCDDVYAEVADGVFMDAWLSEFSTETKGTSIVVVRNSHLNDMLKAGQKDRLCHLSKCEIDDVLRSQQDLIKQKKEAVRFRTAMTLAQGKWIPQKRFEPASKIGTVQYRDARQRIRTIKASKFLWPYFSRLPRQALPIFFILVDFHGSGLKYLYFELTKHFKVVLKKVLPDRLIRALKNKEEHNV